MLLVDPAPPRAAGRLPFVGAGFAFLRNPTQFRRSTWARASATASWSKPSYSAFLVLARGSAQPVPAGREGRELHRGRRAR